MKHVELHIIQSVPVTCLNRDDLNSPKTAIFGGVQRARVSSQCWKRAIRQLLREDSQSFCGLRSRLVIGELEKVLEPLEQDLETRTALAKCGGQYLAQLSDERDDQVKTLVFLSPLEYQKLGRTLHALPDDTKKRLVDAVRKRGGTKDDDETEAQSEAKTKKPSKKEAFKKAVDKALKQPIRKMFGKALGGLPKDAADIALFGRMTAADPSLTVEAAAMFSHALSSHRADNDLDYFSAVDELQPHEDSGSGMIGVSEFTSATYYRFAALNLDMLRNSEHLACMSAEELAAVVRSFLKATILAVPGARRNSMNGDTLPSLVLCLVRRQGHPIQLVNAFEKAVVARGATHGYVNESVQRLRAEYQQMREMWGVEDAWHGVFPCWLDDTGNGQTFEQFLNQAVAEIRGLYETASGQS